MWTRPKVIRLQMPPDQHRSSLCDDIACTPGELSDVQWSPGFNAHRLRLHFARSQNRAASRSPTQRPAAFATFSKKKSPRFTNRATATVIGNICRLSNEFIWFSESGNWGQLYLYDLETGQLKNQITAGDWQRHASTARGRKESCDLFPGRRKEKGRDPYFIHFYRVDFDGKNLKLLTPEDANHEVTLSPSGKYFVDSYSTPDVPPVTVLRDVDGKLRCHRRKGGHFAAAGHRLEAANSLYRESTRRRDRSLRPDVQADEFRSHSKKYPIINHIYPGPQTGSVGSRSFSAARGDASRSPNWASSSWKLDGMGTPWRSKKFHEAYFGDMGDNTLPDQVGGMKQLAQRYPWIDIDRAGIYGHSGGGFATADAMFRYPDFFKVGISESGNHDNRVYEDDWGEKWQGLLTSTQS